MANQVLRIVDGPDKPALEWALAYPEREQVHFRLNYDGVDASILRMNEVADGLSFELEGILTSGVYKSMPFTATYSVGSRHGQIIINQASHAAFDRDGKFKEQFDVR